MPEAARGPDLHLYATYADYNKAAGAEAANNYGLPANKASAAGR